MQVQAQPSTYKLFTCQPHLEEEKYQNPEQRGQQLTDSFQGVAVKTIASNSKKKNPCNHFFSENHCQHGHDCMYSHDRADFNKLKRTRCRDHASGYCKFGDRCFLMHDEGP
jgi:hypothetical protein